MVVGTVAVEEPTDVVVPAVVELVDEQVAAAG